MPDDQYVVDFTEPEPLYPLYGSDWLNFVQIYLASKYYSDLPINVGMGDATIFKIASALDERARITKEHHNVYLSLKDLKGAIVNDIETYVQPRYKRAYRSRSTKGSAPPQSTILKRIQRWMQ